MSDKIKFFENPDYTKKKSDWILYHDLYEGKHSVLVSDLYLWRHILETKPDLGAQEIRKIRQQRTRYLNLIEILISLWISIFFKKNPALDNEAMSLLEIGDAIKNIDGYGTSLTNFIKNKVTQNYLLYGKAIILADAPTEVGISRGDEIARKIRPYWESIEPLNFVDWDIETSEPHRIGKYNLGRHEYTKVDKRTRATQEPKSSLISECLEIIDGIYTVTRYKSSGDKKLNITDSTWTEVSRTTVERFSEIPISVCESESWVKDASQEALRFHNIRSSLDNIVYYQQYQKLFVSGVNISDKEQIKALSEFVISILPENAKVSSIEPVDTSGTERILSESIANVFKVGLNQLRQLPSSSLESQSSDALDSEREYTYNLVETSIEEIETALNDALRNYAIFTDEKAKENFNGKITLNKDITDENIDRFLKIYFAFSDTLKKIDVVEKATLKKAIKNMNLSEEEVSEAYEAIDNLNIEEEPQAETTNEIDNVINGG